MVLGELRKLVGRVKKRSVEVEAILLRMLLLSKQMPFMTNLFLADQMDHIATGKTTHQGMLERGEECLWVTIFLSQLKVSLQSKLLGRAGLVRLVQMG